MEREEFNKVRDFAGIAGLTHTDEDYVKYIAQLNESNDRVRKQFRKHIFELRSVPFGPNTDLSTVEKSQGFIRWVE